MLYTILIGFLAGAVAKMLTPGKDPGGWIITILLGIAGSYVGTFLGRSIGHYQDGQAGWIHRVDDRCGRAAADLPVVHQGQDRGLERAGGGAAGG